MPTIAIIGPYRFSFYCADRKEPAHVHVWRDQCSAKWWLDPVVLAKSEGFKAREIQKITSIVTAHQQQWLEIWNAYFRSR